MKFIKLAFASILLTGSLFTVFKWQGQQQAKAAYNVSFANFWLGTITPGSGDIGVDIWWNSGSGDYLPCQHSNDIYYDACVSSNEGQISYYKYLHYTSGGNEQPYGIFIDNSNTDVCTNKPWCRDAGGGDSISHGWARIIHAGSIEIYPHLSGVYNPSANTVGGVRLHADFFHFANGGRYSSQIGNIALPQLGQSGVGKLNGFVTNNGNPVSNNRVLFEAFQEQATYHSSTGFPLTGFSTVKNNSDGYYNTGALPSGTYKIYITDTNTSNKIIVQGVSIRSTHERLDLRLEQNCFGFPSCTPG